MKRTVMMLIPVLLASMAVAVILYNGQSTAADAGELSVSTGGAPSDVYAVPEDIYYTKAVESVVFSHQTHAVDKQLKCSICHESLFQMDAMSVQEKPDFNMKSLAEGKYCGSCHSAGNDAVFSSTTQCARCHTGVKGLDQADESRTDSMSGSQDQYYEDSGGSNDQYHRGG